ncbi:hypothetical protein DSLASN_42840 [Desulfoluna limicola]|uniref:Uncharacterized protein n=1 Tax=Desulfoluna limicola TaxID=2810562 RepID=A0ABN6F8B7_9BACT|nr:hypothetical protein [Desulfoluna limicola]BCS98652.1 hypothetical protein DSLASN_42840 [Desulfoluna limicola]
MKKFLLTVISFFVLSGVAMAEDVLSVDRAVSGDVETFFENEGDIEPERSDFEVVNYVLMSSEEGARWAVVTLKNTSTGSRIFQQNQLMALFANGERYSPLKHSRTLKSMETVTFSVSFGKSRFPILEVYTRN